MTNEEGGGASADENDDERIGGWSPSWPPEALSMARTALELTRRDWTSTGHSAPAAGGTIGGRRGGRGADDDDDDGGDDEDGGDDDDDDDDAGADEIAERIVALLLMRMVALAACRLGNGLNLKTPAGGEEEEEDPRDAPDGGIGKSEGGAPPRRPKLYSDYSTTTVCRAALPDVRNLDEEPRRQFPRCITPDVISQLRHYVRVICRGYRSRSEVPYHSVEHAYHVFLSANKLLDLMLCETPEGARGVDDGIGEGGNDEEYIMVAGRRRRRGRRSTVESMGSTTSSRSCGSSLRSSANRGVVKKRRNPTFGIKSDPLSQLAFLFSALVHDVDHTGISNRQLVLEMDDLAILYNDQSVAEQRSLAVAFSTLKQGRYEGLRGVLFPPPAEGKGEGGRNNSNSNSNEDFFKFRKLVIDLVLVTDIASPERTQIVKSKWKEAFGEVIVAEKLRKSMMPNSGGKGGVGGGGGSGGGGGGGRGRGGGGARGPIRGGRGNPNRRISFESDIFVASNRVEPIDEVEEKETATEKSSNKNNPVSPVSNVEDGKDRPRQKFARNASQGSLDSGESGGGRRGRGALGRASSQRSMGGGSVGGGGGGLRSSLLSNLSADADSIRDSILMDDDTIDFSDDTLRSSSSSSSLISDMNSLEDDFNASAVSQNKMNFDSFADSFNTISDGSGTNGGGSGGKSGASKSAKTNNGSASSNGNSNRAKNKSAPGVGDSGPSLSDNESGRRPRRSAGDVAEDADGDDVPGRPRRRQIQRCASPPPAGRPGKSFAKSFCVQPLSALPNGDGLSSSFAASAEGDGGGGQRRKPSAARLASRRPQGLSRSMMTHSELRRPGGRPAFRVEERRLGVRRALDLSGSVVPYGGSLRSSTSSNEANLDGPGGCMGGVGGGPDEPDDEVDEFKATVVLEQMMRAADVGALLQDWDNMMKWSTRLYKELKNGHLADRGEDPSVGWYENQIKFFDFYILPLAKNLGVMGVFEEGCRQGNDAGSGGGRRGSGGSSCGGGSSYFVNCVKSNLARWIEEGSRATELMMKEDEEKRSREQDLRRSREQQAERQGQEVEDEDGHRRDRIDGGGLTQPMGSLDLASSGDCEGSVGADQRRDKKESLPPSCNGLSSNATSATSNSSRINTPAACETSRSRRK